MKRYRLTDANGDAWVWDETQLADTLFESALWDVEEIRERVAAMKVGEVITRRTPEGNAERLERLGEPESIWPKVAIGLGVTIAAGLLLDQLRRRRR